MLLPIIRFLLYYLGFVAAVKKRWDIPAHVKNISTASGEEQRTKLKHAALA